MSHPELELVEAWALGALDPDEAHVYEKHLQGCSECRAAVDKAGRAVAAIGFAAPRERAPAGLEDRIVRAFRAARAPTVSGPAAAGPGLAHIAIAVLVALVAWLAIDRLRSEQRVDELRLEVDREKRAFEELKQEKLKNDGKLDELARRLDGVERFLRDDKNSLALATTGPAKTWSPAPVARAVLDANGRVTLVAKLLPPPPAGKAYELWMLPKKSGAKPIPSGTFAPAGEGGFALHAPDAHYEAADVAGFAVSIEDQAGAAVPTASQIVLAGTY